jgi:tetratricopeptide (TPR) repeat protein
MALAAYWPATGFDYISYDDPDYISANPTVKQGLSWHGIRWAFTTSLVGHWHPLTWISLMAGCHWMGDAPRWQHLINIVLHALSTGLVFLAWWRLTGVRGVSAFIACLFAFHPLHVESVAWVASRKDVLSGVFWAASLWFYAGHAKRPTRSSMVPVAACLAVGLLAKPTLLTLPFVLLLLDFWPLNRLRLPGCGPTAGHVPLSRLLLEKAPLFLLSAGSIVMTVWSSHDSGTLRAATQATFLDRCGNAAVSYVCYIAKTLVPIDMAPFYPHPGAWQAWQAGGALAILLILSLLALSCIGRAPWVIVGWLWFLGTLVPMSGFLQVGRQFMADRYSYLPLTGLFLIVSGIATSAAKAKPALQPLLKPAAVILVLGCVLGMRNQLQYWRNSEILFRHTLAVTRNNDVAHQHLAYALREANQIPEARHHFAEVVRLQPNDADARNNLGLALAFERRTAEALEQFGIAAGLNPTNTSVAFNQGMTLQALGRKEEAVQALRTAVAHSTNDSQARVALGRMLLEMNRHDEALIVLAEAAAIDPGSAPARLAHGLVLMRLNRLDQAGAELQAAADLDPGSPEAQTEFGGWLAAQDRAPEAILRYRQALKARGDYLPALNNLAWLLATSPNDTLRNGADAVRLAEQACALTQQRVPFLLGTLAAAYAEKGRYEDAVATATQAADLAEKSGDETTARRNRELRTIYQSRAPWREPSH